MTDTRGQSIVQQLTQVSKQQKAYSRPPAVEEEIKAVLALPLHEAFVLAATGRLRPQTLVYLLRNFRPNELTAEYDAMVVAFFSRLEQAGQRIVADLPEIFRERAHAEVKDKALEWFADDKLDIFECSFKLGAERLYLTARTKMRLRMTTEISREDLVSDDTDVDTEEIADALAYRAGRTAMPLAEARAELQSVLAILTDEERIAITHILVMGLTYKEAAAAMDCSDTKVKYLIKRAREKALGKKA